MRISVITGGASGIGAGITSALRADGHRVIVIDVSEPEEPSSDYIRADLSTREGIAAIEAAISDLAIHDLVHCAAVGHWSSLRETPRDVWERVIAVNLIGTIALTQALLPRIVPGGRIVYFASGTVFKGPANLFAYVASKSGVIGFARSIADEVGKDDITVNVVAPGFTATPIVADMAHTEEANIATRAIKRRGEIGDQIGPVRFLLSDAGAFVTGQTLCVDGGSVKH